tara:strand:- start:244 stop:1401 length:1158 start_codon:yes stop_codon:yes gene_type:complete
MFLGVYQTCGQCDNGVNFYPSSIYNPTSNAWGAASSCNWAGEVIQVSVVDGDAYQFSTCSNYGGTSASYDTQLTLRDASGALIAFNDDFFSCTGFTSYINWTATYTGILYVHLNEYNCLSNTTCTRVMIYRTEVLGPGPCENTTFYTFNDMPTFSNPSETITCYYAGEYCRWDNAEGGVAYTVFSSRPTDWITVRTDAYNGPVDVVGISPVIIQSATAGASYYIHVNVDDLCKVESLCRDITVMRQSPLPITLISFDASHAKDGVLVEWSTLSQINNDYFNVQKSIDGYEWEDKITIPGAGNTNTQMDYDWLDTKPSIGISYYRLKQTDYNGHNETFYPVSVIIRPVIRTIIRTTNLIGQEVDENYKGVVIDIYSDGVNNKRIQE